MMEVTDRVFRHVHLSWPHSLSPFFFFFLPKAKRIIARRLSTETRVVPGADRLSIFVLRVLSYA